MTHYNATISWNRQGEPFTDNRYSRLHRWSFDGGIECRASSSPHVVPEPMSSADAVDPEEAFVAALSSCHMLWFLSLAAKRGYVVETYRDDADGIMARNNAGKLAVSVVTLRPNVTFSGDKQPDEQAFQALHHQAHELCYIANSVKSEVRCEPVLG